jgi:sec-independent protein translocase protein TatB
MLTFGWGEILLVTVVIIVVVGPKDLPKLIKQLSSFTKSLKKLSREFKYSLNEIADHEDFKDVKSSLNEVNKIKDDIDIKGKFKSEIQSLKDTTTIIEKEVKNLKNIENEINPTKETSTVIEKDVHDKNKNKTQDEADLI